MAEMLIDDVKLAACLDAEADAIRAKTGDSNDIPFDYANNKGFADAIAAISSGGGQTYTGSIVLSNQLVDTLTIPVDTSSANYVDVNVVVTRTGVVNDGVVTYHETPTVPDGFGETIFGYSAKTGTRRTATVLFGSTTRNYNVPETNSFYLSARYQYQPNQAGIYLSDSVLKHNGIALVTQNANRAFCRVGYHIEYDYIVAVY